MPDSGVRFLLKTRHLVTYCSISCSWHFFIGYHWNYLLFLHVLFICPPFLPQAWEWPFEDQEVLSYPRLSLYFEVCFYCLLKGEKYLTCKISSNPIRERQWPKAWFAVSFFILWFILWKYAKMDCVPGSQLRHWRYKDEIRLSPCPKVILDDIWGKTKIIKMQSKTCTILESKEQSDICVLLP